MPLTHSPTVCEDHTVSALPWPTHPNQSMRDLHEVVTIISNTGIRAGELCQVGTACDGIGVSGLALLKAQGIRLRSVTGTW